LNFSAQFIGHPVGHLFTFFLSADAQKQEEGSPPESSGAPKKEKN
jgi:hypothetical protein